MASVSPSPAISFIMRDSCGIFIVYQKGQQTSDYHGFLGARDELTESLEKFRRVSPTALIPTHGVVMDNPDRAIDALLQQLARCYDKYVAISALRHYFPKLFTEFEGRAGHMPIRAGKPATRIPTPFWHNVDDHLRKRMKLL